MSKTVSQYVVGVCKSTASNIMKIFSWLNYRPKASLVLLIIIILYLPWSHFSHSYGSSFQHFFKDTLIVRLIIELGIRSDVIPWTIFISLTCLLIFFFIKCSKQRAKNFAEK